MDCTCFESFCFARTGLHGEPDFASISRWSTGSFFSNPNSRTARKNMTVKTRLDDGMTWPIDKQIIVDAKGGAYSSLVMVNSRTLGILYESSRADLVFQTINLVEIGL